MQHMYAATKTRHSQISNINIFLKMLGLIKKKRKELHLLLFSC